MLSADVFVQHPDSHEDGDELQPASGAASGLDYPERGEDDGRGPFIEGWRDGLSEGYSFSSILEVVDKDGKSGSVCLRNEMGGNYREERARFGARCPVEADSFRLTSDCQERWRNPYYSRDGNPPPRLKPGMGHDIRLKAHGEWIYDDPPQTAADLLPHYYFNTLVQSVSIPDSNVSTPATSEESPVPDQDADDIRCIPSDDILPQILDEILQVKEELRHYREEVNADVLSRD